MISLATGFCSTTDSSDSSSEDSFSSGSCDGVERSVIVKL